MHDQGRPLDEKIRRKEAKIGVIGLGYVGLPLAVEYAEKGFPTLGFDIDARKVEKIRRKENYILDIPNERLAACVESGKLEAFATFERLGECDVIYICVPTPFTPNKDPDISYIESASDEIRKRLRIGQLVILKSTTYPETTEKVVLPILERSGLKVGEDFYLAFSPERIDPGNKKFTTANTPVVVGGVTKRCTELAALAIKQVVNKVHIVSSPRAAEMTKLLENIFRSVNIALVNELARLCDRMGGIDIWEVIEAASTKPFGFMPFYPGPGIGGHCILVDPYYLSWKAREYDFHTNFIELAAETNEDMPFYVLGMIRRALSEVGAPFRKARILIVGVAFKKDIDDTRNSPALKLIELLYERGATEVSYCDPFVPEVEVKGHMLRSQPLSAELVQRSDVVVITTNHSNLDYKMIAEHARAIVDTRNALGKFPAPKGILLRLGSGSRF
ncbi:MAG: nucleotide sugar dehydrogenase [candidate division KSB1 bacterium]|nr:nucleotide sugar dehydrogenase [candidate division KSB1 bacterium]